MRGGGVVSLTRTTKHRHTTAKLNHFWAGYDDKEEFWPLLKINLSRPFVMTVTEPIWSELIVRPARRMIG